MATTQDNLKVAFAGESQANQKYRAFAKKAEQDGFPNVARLFLTTAEAERIHAEGELKAMGGVGTTADNLQVAIDGETYEYTEMYPPMVEQAEEVHARLYQMALEAVQRGEDLTEVQFYLCPVCGYIELGSPPEKCPICGAKAASFIQV